MKRIVLSSPTNLAVLLLLSNRRERPRRGPFLTQNGLSLENLLWFSLIFGFGGAFVSLLISKRWPYGRRERTSSARRRARTSAGW